MYSLANTALAQEKCGYLCVSESNFSKSMQRKT